MRGVTSLEVDWVSEEVPDLVEPLLNLVLYFLRVDGLDDSLRDFEEL